MEGTSGDREEPVSGFRVGARTVWKDVASGCQGEGWDKARVTPTGWSCGWLVRPVDRPRVQFLT